MKVAIQSLGCKVNLYESEYITDQFQKAGYEIVPFQEIADVYIINTCSVTNTSDVKSRKVIHQAIRRNPDACIVAIGCFIEANHDYREDGVDILLGNANKSKVLEYVERYWQTKQKANYFVTPIPEKFDDMTMSTFLGRTRAFIKIQDGCENFCSYCIIPYVRGKCRSKNFQTVLEEIQNYVQHGYKEVVLTGIHTGNYGVDLGTDFAALLREIVKINGLVRLRISSIEITELTDEVLQIIRDNDVIVDHLHIPLQAGSDKILRLMNRKYDLAYFKQKMEQIREIRADISLTTDIIVGFPSETEEDFQDTLSFVREVQFSKVHVFPYSRRSGTVAADMAEQVPGDVKKDRVRRLLALSKELETEYMKKFIGKTLPVLMEVNRTDYSLGHTSNYLLVKVPGEYQSEDLVDVTITDVSYPYCLGEVSRSE
ncbi:MAG: tRNA (N(6)-L-threonylcarbamoyladenosine(37)-C(2))-methylthiotransferase MtaB [Candidatus Faecenecus gallistercoris]|nr:tRNA (N(6)-L-threonylcarbamoyladenosine(37)-C(2))-methylthiotransferase MtaB [Bacillota bacterium]MDD7103101.1 tRNA (N(6)-L-threonylcarbamoyladenosine(37)-C(2))-methylthiotransferase MtaB [Bacillota bacterium]MDY4050502.1 tRNA (N(6)-L-threonylcarbamoyladenosine(37)-C(2))-methylthiotransferase MtaB [Candidatus Faecenecus gallistercoris]